jgi:hypothetical protein
MTLKNTDRNRRRKYLAPYAEMIVCEEEECLLDTVSGAGEDPIGGGDGNEEFAKGIGGIWEEGDFAGGSDGVTNVFDN